MIITAWPDSIHYFSRPLQPSRILHVLFEVIANRAKNQVAGIII
jgi:hypothetical protein